MHSLRTPFVLVAVVVSTLLLSSVQAGTVRHDVADVNYTNLAAQTEYDPVGMMLFTNENGSFICSGVLITSEWVLTAGHCTDGTNITATTFTVGGSTYNADLSSITPHPSFSRLNIFTGYDIGLFRLQTPVTNVTPAELYDGDSEVGLTGTSVGFGRTGTGLTGATLTHGTKRAGNNRIDNRGGVIEGLVSFIGVSDRIIFADFDNESDTSTNLTGPTTAPIAEDLEYLIAGGDSGGGLYIEDPDDGDAVKVAAVHSFGARVQDPDGLVGDIDFTLNSTYGELQGSTRVAPFIPWINGIVPEPGTLLILCIGGLVAMRRRRIPVYAADRR